MYVYYKECIYEYKHFTLTTISTGWPLSLCSCRPRVYTHGHCGCVVDGSSAIYGSFLTRVLLLFYTWTFTWLRGITALDHLCRWHNRLSLNLFLTYLSLSLSLQVAIVELFQLCLHSTQTHSWQYKATTRFIGEQEQANLVVFIGYIYICTRSYVVPLCMSQYYALLFNVDIFLLTIYSLSSSMDTCRKDTVCFVVIKRTLCPWNSDSQKCSAFAY